MKRELMTLGGKLVKKVSKKSPTILVGIGMAASVSALIFAVKSSPKAHDIIKEHKEEIDDIDQDLKYRICNEKEARSEKWKVRMTTAWKMAKLFGPSIAFEMIALIAIVFSHRISIRRQMALAALYAGTEAALGDKITELESLKKLLPDKKVDNAKTEAVKEKAAETLPPSPNDIFKTGFGQQLCLDYFTGDWFYADHETVRQKLGNLDDLLQDEGDISIEDIHHELKIPVWPIHKGIRITSDKVRHFRPEFRYFTFQDVPGANSEIWLKHIQPLEPVLAIDYEDAVIESSHVHGRKYNYYGDF